ncbi:MAG: protein kinase domain-containing protein, partial [Planctomycetota bacterium]
MGEGEIKSPHLPIAPSPDRVSGKPSPPPPLPHSPPRISGKPSPPRAEHATAEPMLTDFGLAKDVASETQVTRTGMTLGTPSYMSPEQAEGRLDDVDKRSDVYGLGATLYHMLTLRPPFEGTSAVEVIQKLLLRDPVPPRRVNRLVEKDLETICLKCLEKDPAGRYDGADELAQDLGRYLDGRPITARPVSVLENLLRRARRNRAATAILAALFLVLCIGAVLGPLGYRRWLRTAEERADAEEKKADADRDAETAELGLKKGRRVSAVLRAARTELKDVLLDLQTVYYANRSLADRKEAWNRSQERIADFEKTVPGDSASQAAWLALKGWLLWLGGSQQGAFELFKASRGKDMDVACGHLFEAAFYLSTYFINYPAPPLEATPAGLRFGAPWKEGQDVKEGLREFSSAMAEAEKASVWGETAAGDFRDVMAGFRSLQGGDLDEADRSLSQGLGVPELAFLEVELLIARAKTRYLAMRFDEALADLGRVLKRFETCQAAHHDSGMCGLGKGVVAEHEGRDPVPDYEKAIGSLATIVGITHSQYCVETCLGLLHLEVANVLRDRGKDPLPRIKQALGYLEARIRKEPADHGALGVLGKGLRAWVERNLARGEATEPLLERTVAVAKTAVSLVPEKAAVHDEEGMAWLVKTKVEVAAGVDPRPSAEAAVAAFTRAIELSPDRLETYRRRAETRCLLAGAEAKRGRNPEDHLRKAVEDTTEALRKVPDHHEAHITQGHALILLGRMLAGRGEDPIPWFRKAAEALRRGIQGNSRDFTARGNLGTAFQALGGALEARGEDPLPAFREAIEAYTESLKLNPTAIEPRLNRATLLCRVGEIVEGRGGDGEEDFRRALGECDEALKRNPDAPTAHATKSTAYFMMGRRLARRGGDPLPPYRKALDCCRENLRRSPRDGHGYHQMGIISLAMGSVLLYKGRGREEFEISRGAFMKAVEINPAAVDSWITLGQVHHCLGMLEGEGGDPEPHRKKALT